MGYGPVPISGTTGVMMTATSGPPWLQSSPTAGAKGDEGPSTPAPQQEPTQRGRTWLRWTLPAVALLIGAGAGVGSTLALSDPTRSEEYQELRSDFETSQDELSAARGAIGEAQQALLDAQAAAREATDEAEARSAELDQREADLAAREAAVTSEEERIAATSITEGIWTVGVDIEPGTYRTAEALTGYCYWGIYTSGTNGDDIIENDGPEGGFPTVTLSVGQDFENSGCGTFVKQ